MELFITTSLSFPVVLLSFLLCVAILYWLIAALGLIDIDLFGGDGVEVGDGDGLQAEGLAGLLLKLGLNGVPVTLVLTLLFFFSWILCYFIELSLLSHLPLGLLRYPLGLAVVVGCLLLAVAPTRLLVRPLRPLFHKLEATTSRSLLGQLAVVRSGSVSLSFGEAVVEDGGAGLILRVRAEPALGFKRGDRVVLLEYLEGDNSYRVISEAEFNGELPLPPG